MQRESPFSPVRLAAAAVAPFFVVAVVAVGDAGATPWRSEALHRPFVAGLGAAALLAAVAVWLRYKRSPDARDLLLLSALGLLALVYAPHALLTDNGPDPMHLAYGPVSRLAFALGIAAFAVDRAPAWLGRVSALGAAAVLLAGATVLDLALHAAIGAGALGDDPRAALRAVESPRWSSSSAPARGSRGAGGATGARWTPRSPRRSA